MRIMWRASPVATGGPGAVGARACFAFLSAVLLASVVVPPVREAPFPLCLVHLLLGVAGPGCGMTRAFLFLGHGDFRSALELNPNSLLVFGLVVALWVNNGIRLRCGRELAVVLSPRGKLGVYLVTAALTAMGWLYNLLSNPWT
jgi:hypothetical protein